MTLEFIDSNGVYIKQWPNWDGEIPQKFDIVLIHFGDNNEEEIPYCVHNRIISGVDSKKIIIVVEEWHNN